MGILAGDEEDVKELFEHLAKREQDVICGLRSALAHDDDGRDRVQLENFCASHVEQRGDLIAELRAMGAPAPEGGDALESIDKGKVVLGALAGEKGVLVATKTNVDALANAYVRASTNRRSNERQRAVIERGLANAKWAGAWIEQRLGVTPDVGEAIMAPEGENERAREDHISQERWSTDRESGERLSRSSHA